MPEPKFTPKPGQVDYTDIRWAPVINCLVRHNGKILLVKRSEDLNLYSGFWSGISGFLDDSKSLEEKVKEEIEEELHIAAQDILSIKLGTIFHHEAAQMKKTWIVHPILVDVATDVLRLNWEAAEYVWTTPDEARMYKLLPGFEMVLEAFFSPNTA